MSSRYGWVSEIGEALRHHPHVNDTVIEGIPLRVEEQAVDMFGHNIRVIVLSSPEGKLDGRQIGPYGGAHASQSRQQCIATLTHLVKETYFKK